MRKKKQIHKKPSRYIEEIIAESDRSLGLPRGQKADYRAPLGRGCVHVVEFDDFYELHVDSYDPKRFPFRHFWHDVLGVKEK